MSSSAGALIVRNTDCWARYSESSRPKKFSFSTLLVYQEPILRIFNKSSRSKLGYDSCYSSAAVSVEATLHSAGFQYPSPPPKSASWARVTPWSTPKRAENNTFDTKNECLNFLVVVDSKLLKFCQEYRVTHHVDSNLPLASKQKFCFSTWA